jgi:hypothetical protein
MTLSWEISNGIFAGLNVLDSSVCQMCQGASQVKCFSTWISQPSYMQFWGLFYPQLHGLGGLVTHRSHMSGERKRWLNHRPQPHHFTTVVSLFPAGMGLVVANGPVWDFDGGWDGKSSQRIQWEVSQIIASWFLTTVPALSPGSLVKSLDHRELF